MGAWTAVRAHRRAEPENALETSFNQTHPTTGYIE